MRSSVYIAGLALFASRLLAQEIAVDHVYTTTWDRSSLLAYADHAKSAPGWSSSTIYVDQGTSVHQNVSGFGATLTDTAASTLLELRTANNGSYWQLLNTLFDSTTSTNAGLAFLRVTLAASDFSPTVYSFDGSLGDSSLKSFSTSNASNITNILRDIRSINSGIQLHLVPWSPPVWMKTGTNGVLGGSFNSSYTSAYATYLYRAISTLVNQTGITPYSLAIQNEPLNENWSYPTCIMSVDNEGQIATALRSMLDHNGLASVKIIGYEHNWDQAGAYPVQLMQKYASAFAGVSFHCYNGSYQQQANFTSVYPDKEVYFTECTGNLSSTDDWWGDMKWMTNLYIGALEFDSRTAMMWNLAANPAGGPMLPGATSCGAGGCRPVVTVDGGNYTLNQEFYALAHMQRALLSTDSDTLQSKRMMPTIVGSSSWALRAGGYVMPNQNPSNPSRFSLVVINWDDSATKTFQAQSVTATINFFGRTMQYEFPVGVTTLSWTGIGTLSTNGNGNHGGDGAQWNGSANTLASGSGLSMILLSIIVACLI